MNRYSIQQTENKRILNLNQRTLKSPKFFTILLQAFRLRKVLSSLLNHSLQIFIGNKFSPLTRNLWNLNCRYSYVRYLGFIFLHFETPLFLFQLNNLMTQFQMYHLQKCFSSRSIFLIYVIQIHLYAIFIVFYITYIDLLQLKHNCFEITIKSHR